MERYNQKQTIIQQIFIVCAILFALTSCSSSEDVMTQTGEVTLKNIAETKPNQLSWLERSQIKSRNRSSSGYGVILNPESKKLLLFLDGGGACFNGITCALNRNKFTETDFFTFTAETTSFLINRTSNDNQFKDWNVIFVPYINGDVHSGSKLSVDVPSFGPTNQEMVGYNNITLILNELKNYFESNGGIEEIVFAGSSAGGFGVLTNTNQMATILGSNKPTTVIVDAGQIMYGTDLLTPCLNQRWDNLWSLSDRISGVTDVGTYVTESYSYDVQKIYEYLSKKYPSFNFGFLSHYEDKTNRFFYSFGKDNCVDFVPSDTPKVTGEEFKAGLLNLKTNVFDDLDNWKVFYRNGVTHTFLDDDNFDQTAGGTTLNAWIQALRNGEAEHKTD